MSNRPGPPLRSTRGSRGLELAICLLGVCNLVRMKLPGGTSSITSFKTLILQIGKLIRILRAASLEPRSPGWQSLGVSWDWTTPVLRAHLVQMSSTPCRHPCALLSCVFAPSVPALWNALSSSWTFFAILHGVPQMSLFLEFSKLGQILFCRPHTAALMRVSSCPVDSECLEDRVLFISAFQCLGQDLARRRHWMSV